VNLLIIQLKGKNPNYPGWQGPTWVRLGYFYILKHVIGNVVCRTLFSVFNNYQDIYRGTLYY